ncbi:MAG: hypothetical protein L3K15_06030 [Thermoplasmata archaeon]|nr:hypothetical protein [Thermoplasmata archaeon]
MPDPAELARRREAERAEAARLERVGSKAMLALLWSLAAVFIASGIVLSNEGRHPNYPGPEFVAGGIILLAIGILATILYGRKYSGPR